MGGQIVDLESRIRNNELEEQQLQILLGQTNNIDEILRVRTEINQVREQIELLQGELAYLSDRVNYASAQVILIELEGDGIPKEEKRDEWNLALVWNEAWDGLVNDYQFLIEGVVRLGVRLLFVMPLIFGGGLLVWLSWKKMKSRR